MQSSTERRILILNFLPQLKSNPSCNLIMAYKNFSQVWNWLKSSEMFARPSKQLPGKWELFEYYTESGKELLNIKEKQLEANSEFWKIDFTAENKFSQDNNLPVWQITKVKNGNWSILQNFITLVSADNKANSIEFQFAIEKGTLKLLKKDALGRIEFFGFFNKDV